ncbi:hypothetical protein TNCV_834841 [Trichonephila clavipes]|nr:hypothetical protein TNCV_834841 [Trichonephila clavipes]
MTTAQKVEAPLSKSIEMRVETIPGGYVTADAQRAADPSGVDTCSLSSGVVFTPHPILSAPFETKEKNGIHQVHSHTEDILFNQLRRVFKEFNGFRSALCAAIIEQDHATEKGDLSLFRIRRCFSRVTYSITDSSKANVYCIHRG